VEIADSAEPHPTDEERRYPDDRPRAKQRQLGRVCSC
jgi:hypothetical protein